ncbi:embryonic polarity protein dorsal-like [Trichogramma pretiosum]|uniref:embryonic polarity protein dorsal-like n=1 Tax=Trichogramma pretiosum TaxID=7493 RepID=UPI0006C95462|nr:embryonic polarity protein dorsal-like [Trichogramma pretiosum]
MLSQERASGLSLPRVTFHEQPAHRALFRWAGDACGCESQIGSRDPRRADCPSIIVHNYEGPVLLTISLVTSQEPHYPHPYLLQGGRGYKMSKGICYFRARAEPGKPIELRNLRVKKLAADSLRASLLDRRNLCYDPFQTNYEHLEELDQQRVVSSTSTDSGKQSIDLTSARLCVTAYLDHEGRFDYCLLPAVSEPIHDSRDKPDLTIVWLSHVAGPPAGHQICCLLAGRVERDDVEVHFYDDANEWQAVGLPYPPGVYENTAIVFSTPAYRGSGELEQPVTVNVRLRLKSDPSVTSPRVYRYTYQSSYSDERDCLFKSNKRPKIAPQDLIARTLAAGTEPNNNNNKIYGRKEAGDSLLKLQMERVFDKNLAALDSTPSMTATHSVSASSGGSATQSRNEHHPYNHQHRLLNRPATYLESIYPYKKPMKQEHQQQQSGGGNNNNNNDSTTSVRSCTSDAASDGHAHQKKYSDVAYEFDPLLR